MPWMGFIARLRSTYWFVPSLLTALAIALAAALISIDAAHPGLKGGIGWLYAGGAEGARSLLSAVAGSMMTVVSVTFSVTIVAITVSSQHFGPRLLNSFMRDTAAQIVLGTFIGTFAYCVVVLRTVEGASESAAGFVPHLSVTAGVALTLLSIAMLIFYVHHVAASLQVSQIASGIAADLERTIDRMYPERIGTPADGMAAPDIPAGASPLAARTSGYVQEIDADRLLEWATTHDATLWIVAHPGEFVTEGSPLAMSSTAAAQSDAALINAFVLGADRTPLQDAGFAVQQLTEVALHALSPGINEPFTAVTCIDRLGQGLARLAARAIPASRRVDADGALRVVAPARTFVDLLDDAFGPLRGPASEHASVTGRLLRTLAMLAERASRPKDLVAIREQIEALQALAAERLPDGLDRERVSATSTRALATVARSLHQSTHG